MMSEQTENRTLQGRVVSDKMDKTVTVVVERRVKHPSLWEVHASFHQGSCA